jgi:hypothetical protein
MRLSAYQRVRVRYHPARIRLCVQQDLGPSGHVWKDPLLGHHRRPAYRATRKPCIARHYDKSKNPGAPRALGRSQSFRLLEIQEGTPRVSDRKPGRSRAPPAGKNPPDDLRRRSDGTQHSSELIRESLHNRRTSITNVVRGFRYHDHHQFDPRCQPKSNRASGTVHIPRRVERVALRRSGQPTFDDAIPPQHAYRTGRTTMKDHPCLNHWSAGPVLNQLDVVTCSGLLRGPAHFQIVPSFFPSRVFSATGEREDAGVEDCIQQHAFQNSG